MISQIKESNKIFTDSYALFITECFAVFLESEGVDELVQLEPATEVEHAGPSTSAVTLKRKFASKKNAISTLELVRQPYSDL